MSISYNNETHIFNLSTASTTYLIGLSPEGYVGHIYYGARLNSDSACGYADAYHLLRTEEHPFTPSVNAREKVTFLNVFPSEYPTGGIGDHRESCLNIRSERGNMACELTFQDYRIYDGKPGIPGLPASFGSEEDVQTLEILCEDAVLGVRVTLVYSTFEKEDIITRSERVENISGENAQSAENEKKEVLLSAETEQSITPGKSSRSGNDQNKISSYDRTQEENEQGDRESQKNGQMLVLEKVYSACLDMDNEDFEMLTLCGAWGRERQIQRRKIGFGKQLVSSIRGESSHQEHPFLALVTPGTTQKQGEVYAMHFVYSGNFIAQAEVTEFNYVRMVMGINAEEFAWHLAPGECFYAPEAVLTYSAEGLGKMTRSLHDFYRQHLIRSPYRNKQRPILLNNWEATYFDFNTEKLLEIAREAKKAGIEMLVMDDGWFGRRNSDNCSLGDWVVNEEKLPGGLKYLAEEVNKIGLKFGIWFEPEMVSRDSDLYRAHPDWAICIPGRTGAMCRAQYVLDISNPEVRDYVYESVAKILRSAPIAYVKWDMNRTLSDLGSAYLAPDRQQELFHRYVLGVYELQERLITEFPDLLLENCSAGGARFDPGMLYYSPQIWCSDDADAVERLKIQEGTALIYPLSTMGAHVAACPNHTVGRVTPFETRGNVALMGTFGYELDVTKLSDEEKAMIPGQVALYHKYNDLVREGDYYRLASYAENGSYDCVLVAAKDKSEALMFYTQARAVPNLHSRKIRLDGLDGSAVYVLEESGEAYSGDVLMKAGFLVKGLWGDAASKLYHFMVRK
ncbi:MAG: alpha-galactosidase [Lachnospiraceae bacterium]|nr:alpha-galactosidase [Lachnospiraceae bacterium]